MHALTPDLYAMAKWISHPQLRKDQVFSSWICNHSGDIRRFTVARNVIVPNLPGTVCDSVPIEISQSWLSPLPSGAVGPGGYGSYFFHCIPITIMQQKCHCQAELHSTSWPSVLPLRNASGISLCLFNVKSRIRVCPGSIILFRLCPNACSVAPIFYSLLSLK